MLTDAAHTDFGWPTRARGHCVSAPRAPQTEGPRRTSDRGSRDRPPVSQTGETRNTAATSRHPVRRPGPQHCVESGHSLPADQRNGRSDRRAAGLTDGAICVQRLDDSLNSAIHTRYRSSRRSSSMHEPRGPPLKVVLSTFTIAPGVRTMTHTTNNHRGPGTHTRLRLKNRSPGGTRSRPREGAQGGPPCKKAEGPGFDGLLSARPSPVQPLPTLEGLPTGGASRATVHGQYPLGERASSVMILPQVHLRKPCYDFYFL